MVDKNVAILIRDRSLRVVEELSTLLFEIKDNCSEDDFVLIKRRVGSVIGRIQVDILRNIYLEFPDLNDLAESEQ